MDQQALANNQTTLSSVIRTQSYFEQSWEWCKIENSKLNKVKREFEQRSCQI